MCADCTCHSSPKAKSRHVALLVRLIGPSCCLKFWIFWKLLQELFSGSPDADLTNPGQFLPPNCIAATTSQARQIVENRPT
jgi:hypothetical protein